jgi:hypothetical protein
MIDQPTETQNRENPAAQSHGSKVNSIFDQDCQTAEEHLQGQLLQVVPVIYLISTLSKG